MSTISAGTTTTTALVQTGDTTGELVIKTNNGNTTAATFTTAGNVGIGTSNPQTRLHAAASSPTRGIISVASATGSTGAQVQITQSGIEDWVIGQPAGVNAFAFWSGRNSGNDGTERMRITSSGVVNIGTSATPLASVYATVMSGIQVANAGNGGYAELSLAGGGKSIYTYTGAVGSETYTERMRIDDSGRLLVGLSSAFSGNSKVQFEQTTTSWWPLALKSVDRGVYCSMTGSEGYALYMERSGGTLAGYIYVNSNNTVSYATSSDYRLKENIAPMTGALAKVQALKPCTYTWKFDGSNGEGFIAHELAEVCPDAVSGEKDAVDDEGNIKAQGIDTSFLVATLTAAIQEQQAIINEQASTIAAFEARLSALEAK